MYDLFMERPAPLAPRHLRFELNERRALRRQRADAARPGRGAAPDRGPARASASRRSRCACCTAIAIRRTSRRSASCCGRTRPRSRCALSCEVVAEIREYDRTSTTLTNVYVQGLASRLPAAPRDASARARHRRRPVRHAVERRRVRRRDRVPVSRAPDRVRPGGRRARGGALRSADPLPEPALVRHGRHHRQGLPDRARRAADRAAVRGRPQVPLQEGQRPAGQGAGDRDDRDRRRRRQHRPHRRRSASSRSGRTAPAPIPGRPATARAAPSPP